MPEGALPNFIIIGAMKCATSSLYRYLDHHPSISMSRRKELNFFSKPSEWAKGVDWYRSWFDPSAPMRGEACPGYTNDPVWAGVAERMYGLVPDARLIYLVRDPLDRLKSHYRHLAASRMEPPDLVATLESGDHSLLWRSLYAHQLEQYLPFYSLDRILVVQQETLLDQREAELERVFRFLGVDSEFRSVRFHYRHHRSTRKRRLNKAGVALSKLPGLRSFPDLPGPLRVAIEEFVYRPFSEPVPAPELSASLEERLLERFHEDTQRLRALTGMAFEGWRV